MKVLARLSGFAGNVQKEVMLASHNFCMRSADIMVLFIFLWLLQGR